MHSEPLVLLLWSLALAFVAAGLGAVVRTIAAGSKIGSRKPISCDVCLSVWTVALVVVVQGLRTHDWVDWITVGAVSLVLAVWALRRTAGGTPPPL